MARGYFSGVIAGALVSALGLGTVSVVTFEASGRAPEAGGVDVPAGSGFNQARDDTSAAIPSAEETPDAGSAPEVTAPEPDDLAALENADTDPAAQPETGGADGALTTPEAGDGEGGVNVDSEDPVLPSPQSQAPEAPAGEEDLSISTDPAQPVTPDASEEAAAFPETDAASTQEPASQEESAPEETTVGDEPAMEQPAVEDDTAMAEPGVEEDAVMAEPAAEDDTAMAEPAGENDTAMAEPAAEDDTAMAEPATQEENSDAAMVEDATPAPAPEMTEETQPEPESGETGAADSAGETTDVASATVPSGTIGDLAPEVKTNRLPSVGREEQAEEAEPTEAVQSEEVTTEDTLPPLQKYAAEFDNSGDKPLMSIVLIDDGSSPVGLQALESFPYPLTFAIPANRTDAADAMTIYRAAGFEVMALVDLPEGAGAQDAEVAMQVIFNAVPEAVAIMEGTESGLQSSRAAAEQLAPILLESGHGIVLFPQGLNTAQKLLAREGVPSAPVFRDFDAKGQSATVIRRFLDQAAFKAGQENAGVVMVGRLRPETVSALLLWGLQDRAERVALAPISALLTRGE